MSSMEEPTDFEKQVVAIFESTLGLSPLPVHVSFFELGGRRKLPVSGIIQVSAGSIHHVMRSFRAQKCLENARN